MALLQFYLPLPLYSAAWLVLSCTVILPWHNGIRQHPEIGWLNKNGEELQCRKHVYVDIYLRSYQEELFIIKSKNAVNGSLDILFLQPESQAFSQRKIVSPVFLSNGIPCYWLRSEEHCFSN